jgi:hypothetical protein
VVTRRTRSAVTAEPDEACFSGRSPLPPSAGYAPHYNGMNGLIPEETIMVFNINDRQVHPQPKCERDVAVERERWRLCSMP